MLLCFRYLRQHQWKNANLLWGWHFVQHCKIISWMALGWNKIQWWAPMFMCSFHEYVRQPPQICHGIPLSRQYSITIKSRYTWFAPRWKILGQLKYLETYHDQPNCLLKNNTYSQLEEARQNWCVRTYHGWFGIFPLAHNQWLDLNNKEFLLYPSVRTLDGMSRQVQFIGLTQKAKSVVETIYSAGSISECIIHRSGMGSKGNCTLEKTLMGHVVSLFLRNLFGPANLGRVPRADTWYCCNRS